jgi:transcriptional regulator with XRE-family HTH domain
MREIREGKGISLRKLEVALSKQVGADGKPLKPIQRGVISRMERGKLELFPGYKRRIEDVLGEEITEN